MSGYQPDTPKPLWAQQWPSVWLHAVLECIERCGAAAHSALWMQIIADGCGYPVWTIEQEVEAAMGAALLAAVGTQPVLPEVARKGWVPLVERARPDPQRVALYADRFDIYKGLYPAMKPFMHRLQTS